MGSLDGDKSSTLGQKLQRHKELQVPIRSFFKRMWSPHTMRVICVGLDYVDTARPFVGIEFRLGFSIAGQGLE